MSLCVWEGSIAVVHIVLIPLPLYWLRHYTHQPNTAGLRDIVKKVQGYRGILISKPCMRKTPNFFYSIPKMPYKTVMPGFWYLEVILVAQITMFFFAKHGQWTFSKHCDQRVHACNRQRSLFVQWCIRRVVLIGWQCKLLNANRRLLNAHHNWPMQPQPISVSCSQLHSVQPWNNWTIGTNGAYFKSALCTMWVLQLDRCPLLS